MQDTEKTPKRDPAQYVRVILLLILLAATAGFILHKGLLSRDLAALGPLGSIVAAVDPSAAKAQAARNDLAGRIASESGGKITLADFQKTDGQANQNFGIEGYSLTFTGVITFGAGGFWEAHYMGSPFSFNFSTTGMAFGGLNGETRVQAGSQMRIAGRMDGQKSEQGWHFDLTSCQVAQ